MKILEFNSIHKDLRNKIRFALCIPSIYRVGMSSLALHTIYSILNSFEDVACERVFVPMGNYPVCSLESGQPLNTFDIIAFSLHFEINYTNVLKMLIDSKIPIYSKNRKSNHPIIIAGGPICANPIPLSPFIDLFVIGDFEPVVEKILEIFRYKQDREYFLEQCSELEGIYVPKLENNKVKKVFAKRLDDCPHPISQIVPQVENKSPFFPSLGKSFLLEICRGCNRGCNFCLIGFEGRPARFRSFRDIERIISEGIEKTKLRKVSLIGSGLSDHPDIENICWYIVDQGLELSLSSLRVDCVSDELLRALNRGNQKSLTLAPEVGSERLLKIINKGFSIKDILGTIENVKRKGIKNIKLYFMMNLPTETLEDLNGIVELVQKIKKIGFGGVNLKLSINSFIPKSHTPFQWESPPNLEILKNKIKVLKKGIKSKINFLNPNWAVIQSYLSLGGSNMGEIIYQAAKLGGTISSWKKAFKNSNFKPKKIELDSVLPWDFIEFKLDKKTLKNIYEKAIQ
ncbi:MAG: radical SAM protein [Candidatus Helarchaeota archaeon]